MAASRFRSLVSDSRDVLLPPSALDRLLGAILTARWPTSTNRLGGLSVVVLALAFIGAATWVLLTPRTLTVLAAPPTPWVRPAEQTDPEIAGCEKDVQNIGSATARSRGTKYGNLALRYSPRCQAVWPQFMSSKRVPTGVTVRMDVRRPADDMLARFDFPYTVKPQIYTMFGNLLHSDKGCVLARWK